MTLEDTIRQSVREEVRTAVREELRAVLAELKPSAPVDELLTVEQVAQRVGRVMPDTVREWIKTGKLRASRAGHRYLVAPADLAAYLTQSTAAPKAALNSDEHLSLLLARVDGTNTKRRK